MLDSSLLPRRIFTAAVVLCLFSSISYGQSCPVIPPTGEIPPGRIRNAEDLQYFQGIVYNSEEDSYRVIYKANTARVLGLNPDGSLTPEIVISPLGAVQDVAIAYNPDRNEYLATWRHDDPTHLYGRYLNGSVMGIGWCFLIV
jgi:hypothetical protein